MSSRVHKLTTYYIQDEDNEDIDKIKDILKENGFIGTNTRTAILDINVDHPINNEATMHGAFSKIFDFPMAPQNYERVSVVIPEDISERMKFIVAVEELMEMYKQSVTHKNQLMGLKYIIGYEGYE